MACKAGPVFPTSAYWHPPLPPQLSPSNYTGLPAPGPAPALCSLSLESWSWTFTRLPYSSHDQRSLPGLLIKCTLPLLALSCLFFILDFLQLLCKFSAESPSGIYCCVSRPRSMGTHRFAKRVSEWLTSKRWIFCPILSTLTLFHHEEIR